MTRAVSRHDYRRQSRTYDRTRAASPSILGAVRAVLSHAPPGRLVDVGGGTGNYAAALAADGWAPTVVDVSAEMLARAVDKGLPVVRADAVRLPLSDGSVDAVVMISMLHLVADWRTAVADAARVLRAGGVLAVMVYARENLAVHWVFDYFPAARRRVRAEHQSLAELTTALPGARVSPFVFTDLQDASLAALCRHPDLLLHSGWRAQTSFFERLASDDPDELNAGLAALERDLAAGHRPDLEVEPVRRRAGDGTVIGWLKP